MHALNLTLCCVHAVHSGSSQHKTGLQTGDKVDINTHSEQPRAVAETQNVEVVLQETQAMEIELPQAALRTDQSQQQDHTTQPQAGEFHTIGDAALLEKLLPVPTQCKKLILDYSCSLLMRTPCQRGPDLEHSLLVLLS